MPSNSHSTGANTTPLGRINPAMSSAARRAASSSLLNPNYMTSDDENAVSGYPIRNEYHQPPSPPSYIPHASPAVQAAVAAAAAVAATWKREPEDSDSNSASGDRKRKKRRSRWGGEEKEKTFIPGMPTVLPANLTKDQEEAYLGNFHLYENRSFFSPITSMIVITLSVGRVFHVNVSHAM